MDLYSFLEKTILFSTDHFLLPYKSFFFFLKKKKEVWNLSPSLIFSMTFEVNLFPCYILLTDQISLSLYVLQLFVNQVVTS